MPPVETPIAPTETPAAPAPAPTVTPPPVAPPPAAPVAPVAHFLDGLPPELAGEKSLESWKGKSRDEFVKGFIESQKFVGGSVRLPTDKDTPEQRTAKLDDLANKLGRPATAEAYVMTPAQLPEGMQWDEAKTTAFRPVAHALRLTQEQVTGLLQWQTAQDIAQAQRTAQQQAGWIKELRETWGLHAETNLALAKRGLETYGGRVLNADESKALVALLDSSGLGSYPPLVKLFAAIGAAHDEGGLITGTGAGPTPESIDAEMTKIRSELMKDGLPHEERQALLTKLLTLQNGRKNPLAAAMQG